MRAAVARVRRAARILGLVMIVTGLGLALATIPWSRVMAQSDMGVGQELVVVPGSSGTVELPTGTWMLLHEGPQVLTDDNDLGPTVPPAVTVTGPDGAPVALDIQVTGPDSRPLTTTVYTEGERRGAGFATFEVTTAGEHTVTVAPAPGVDAVAVNQDHGIGPRDLVLPIVGFVVAGVGLLLRSPWGFAKEIAGASGG